MATDLLGRNITYLRVSVTDRCNLRCVYCMPPQGVCLQSHKEIMRYEEIIEVIKAAVDIGVRSIRITGGEPLVRPGLVDFIKLVAEIPEIEDISMTTNAVLLEDKAGELAEAGLNRVNISLDTLDPEKFSRITRNKAGAFEKVWKGIRAAERAGLYPIKINAVVVKGINDNEIVDLASLTYEHDWHVRFIELMPVNNQSWLDDGFPPFKEAYQSSEESKAVLSSLGLEPCLTPEIGSGPAQLFTLKGARGRIGFISAVGEHFCQSCNRLRLTADGNLRPCLLHDIEIPVLPAIRAGEPVLALVKEAIRKKPAGHELSLEHFPKNRHMMEIGG